MDLAPEIKDLANRIRAGVARSKEEAGEIRKALRITRKIVKLSIRLQKAANRDEKRTRVSEIPEIRADLDGRLKEIKKLVGDIWMLKFTGGAELAAKLDGAVAQMEKDFEKNWPEFERMAKDAHPEP